MGDAATAGEPGVMIVLDSGMTTVDPTDLRDLGWDVDPAAVVEDLRRRDHLPVLTGWDIRFVGLGRVAGEQPEPALPQRRWIEALWVGVCHGGGARSCQVEHLLETAVPPRTTRAVPVVPIPVATTLRADDGVVTTTLPASRLGFTEGSAELPADADAALGDVLAFASSGRFRVGVAGFVAFWGSDSYRAELSTARAVAVADRLVARGVPAELISAAGHGASDGPQASQIAGVFDEAKVRANGLRRVVITLTPLPGA